VGTQDSQVRHGAYEDAGCSSERQQPAPSLWQVSGEQKRQGYALLKLLGLSNLGSFGMTLEEEGRELLRSSVEGFQPFYDADPTRKTWFESLYRIERDELFLRSLSSSMKPLFASRR
jgi:hypothetical protein